MANRKALITQDNLYCPACKQDYSNTNLVDRFERSGNLKSINFLCDCNKTLALKKLSNFFKIYDITETKNRQKEYDKQRYRGIKKAFKDHWNMRKDNYLICYWCNHDNDLKSIEDMFKAFPLKDRIHYSCDKCNRKSGVQITSRGFYSMYPADKKRFFRNVEKGTARLITLAER